MAGAAEVAVNLLYPEAEGTRNPAQDRNCVKLRNSQIENSAVT